MHIDTVVYSRVDARDIERWEDLSQQLTLAHDLSYLTRLVLVCGL